MNPIQNLTDKTFDELDYFELLQVMNAFCDQNSYENYFEADIKMYQSIDNAIARFNNTIGGISLLENFFKYWTE